MIKKTTKNQYLNSPNAFLLLENGDIFWGFSLGSKNEVIGELCFNTSHTGYQEILTDPSYANQIITFTFPHIGIVGTNNIDNESKKVHAKGCVISNPSVIDSNWRSQKKIDYFLTKNNIACIYGIDTRQLSRTLAEKGAMKAALVTYKRKSKNLIKYIYKIKKWPGLKNKDLAKIVSTKKSYKWKEKKYSNLINDLDKKNFDKNNFRIICLDFGIKKNIIRNLKNLNFETIILPANTTFENIDRYNPQGIVLSNGPGDPFATGVYAVPTIKKLLKKQIPIFGICLGHQLLSLALNIKTKKMFQGHRGANHPVKNIIRNTVEITSQNHGFEVDRKSFNKNIIETHISLFDHTNEGIKHKTLPAFSVQYHPEASPGPHDSSYLFKEFYKLVQKYAEKKRY